MANKISLAPELVLSQHQGGLFLHGVYGKRCHKISVGEQPPGYDIVIPSSCVHEAFATRLGAYEPKVILDTLFSLSGCGLL